MADALAEGTEKDMAAGLLPLQVPLLSPPSPHLAPQPPVPSQDVARRIHRAWWARFTFNGITRYERGAYGLVGGVAEGFCAAVELSDAEREELLQLCRQRLDAFRMQRGEEVTCLLIQKPADSATAAATARRSAARETPGAHPCPRCSRLLPDNTASVS